MSVVKVIFLILVAWYSCYVIPLPLIGQCDLKKYQEALSRSELLFKTDRYKQAPDILIQFLKSQPQCDDNRFWMVLDTLLRQLYLIEDFKTSELVIIEILNIRKNKPKDIPRLQLRYFEHLIESWQLNEADSLKKILSVVAFDPTEDIRFVLSSSRRCFRLGHYQDGLDILDAFLKNNKNANLDHFNLPLKMLLWQFYYYLGLNKEMDLTTKEMVDALKNSPNVAQEYSHEIMQFDIAASTRLSKNREALSKAEVQVLVLNKSIPVLKDKFIPRSYFVFANCLRNSLKIRKCDTILNEALKRIDHNKINHKRNLCEIYYLLGVNQRSFGNFDASADYFIKAIAHMEQLAFPSTRGLASYHQQLGETYTLRREYDRARFHLEQGLQLERTIHTESQVLLRHIHSLCELSYFTMDTHAIKGYIKDYTYLVNKFSKQLPPLRKLDFIYMNLRLNNMLLRPEAALAEAEKFMEAYGNNMKEQGLISDDLYYEISTAYYILGDKVKGLKHLEQRLTNVEANMNLKSSPQNLIHYAILLEEAYEAWWNKYLDEKSKESLDRGNYIFQKLDDVLTRLHENSSGFKSFFLADNTVYSIANVLIQQFQAFGDKNYIEKTYKVLERLKLNKLRTSIGIFNATQHAGLSTEYINREADARAALAMAKEKLYEVTEMSTDSTQYYSNRLADASIAYSHLISEMELKFPKFMEIKQQNLIPDLSELQESWLKKDETYLEFFHIQDLFIAIVINKDSAVVVRQSLPGLSDRLTAIYKVHSDFFIKEEAYASSKLSLEDYLNHLVYLDSVLILPIRLLLRKNIYYIPHLSFSNFPLDILVNNPPNILHRTHALNFFVNHYNVSTLPSLSLNHYIQSIPPTQNKAALCFAPFSLVDTTEMFLANNDLAAISRSAIQPLKSSAEEVTKIAKIINGTALTGIQASKPSFINLASSAKYIHIATHGHVDAIDIEKGYLSFKSGAGHGVEKLYYSTISNLRIQADLVTLSSCMTGTGKYIIGEGNYSLSRAFQIAGAKNVISVLWQVPDAPTKELMILFYKELKIGTSISQSLAKAKTLFIQKYKQWSHPVYWAGFILNGK